VIRLSRTILAAITLVLAPSMAPASLIQQAGACARAVRRRRGRRRAGTLGRPGADQDLGAAARDRKPSRRRRHHRVAGADPIAAGRLHPDPGRRGPPDQSVLLSKLPYDTLKDFTPITAVANSPLTINVARNSPIKDLKGLLDLARSKPGTVSYGTPSNGTSSIWPANCSPIWPA